MMRSPSNARLEGESKWSAYSATNNRLCVLALLLSPHFVGLKPLSAVSQKAIKLLGDENDTCECAVSSSGHFPHSIRT